MIAHVMKRLLWPGPDYGTRARYGLRRRFLSGPGITTLDIGCGNGCMTMAAAQRGASAVGVSIDAESLARARAFAARMGLADRCRFEARSIFDRETESLGSFDQVILFEVLEHLVDDEKAMAICAGRLKPGGWLHITVPNRDNHMHFEGISRVENGAHVRHGYDFRMLEELARRHGLEPVDRLGVGRIGTIAGFLAVAHLEKVPGMGRAMAVLGFFVMWPIVQLLNLLPCRPWSLYVLAVKR